MRVRFITDTAEKSFEDKINEALEEIEEFGTIKGINATVSHTKAFHEEIPVSVGNFFSALIAYEE